MTKPRLLAFCLCLFVVLFAAVVPLMPFHDDWTYLTAPHPDFTWSQLLPGAAFWRPFDALWGAALGLCPCLFPWVNRFAIVLGHVVCVWFVVRILEILKGDEGVRGTFAAVCFFAVSSGIAACVVNADSINLIWSTAFGCLGTLLLLSNQSAWKWIVCYVLSILFKESGVSWLAVGPLLALAKDFDKRNLSRSFVAGICILACYLCFRFLLQGKASLGNEGDYALTFSPIVIAKNLAILVGMSTSSIDGLAWAFGDRLLFFTTVILSLLAWASLAISLDWRNHDTLRRLLIGVLIILSFAAPHCLFRNHHPAEMHFYPVLLGGAFLIALLPIASNRISFFHSAAFFMACLFLVGWGDKLFTIYKTSASAKSLLADIKRNITDFNTPTSFTVKSNPEFPRYSVFSQPPAWCLDYGKALRSLNSWRDSQLTIIED